VGRYYTIEFSTVENSMRRLISYFVNDASVVKPLQEHYDRLNDDLLKEWFSHLDEYKTNQNGYLVNLFNNTAGKIAVIVGDGVRYEVAESVAQQLDSEIVIEKKSMFAGLPSETEHNMSLLYSSSQEIIPVQKEREKNLLKETGKDITFMKLEDVNSETDANLLVLTYKDIDDAGEKMQQGALKLFDEFEKILVEKITLLLHLGYDEVYLITDHGFVLTGILEESDKINPDVPGMKDVSERYIRSVEEPKNKDFIVIQSDYGDYSYVGFARSCRPFKSVGKYGYSHGGFTPQEVIIPNFIFRKEQYNKMQVHITNKRELEEVSGDLLQVNVKALTLDNSIQSSMRKVRVVLYVDNLQKDASSIISMYPDKEEKVELSIGNADEGLIIVIDEVTKDQLDRTKVFKVQMRDLGGLF
jgi:hypothetical protein